MKSLPITQFDALSVETQKVLLTVTTKLLFNAQNERTQNTLIKTATATATATANKSAKQLDSEILRTSKLCAKLTHNGFFNVFNIVKGLKVLDKDGLETKIKVYGSIQGKAFNASDILGSMNFNEFIQQLSNGGKYTPAQIVAYVHKFEALNDGDKEVIAERGTKIKNLLSEFKGGTAILETLNAYIGIFGLPVKKNKAGEQLSTCSQTAVKFLFKNCSVLYEGLKLAEKFPLLHEVLTAPIVDEVAEFYNLF